MKKSHSNFLKQAVTVIAAVILVFSTAGCKTDADEAPAKYTVTFNADGGIPAPAVQTVTDNGKAEQPVDPVSEGFHFGGWVKPDGSIYDFNTPVTADITLTAKWQIIVTFDANGGTFKDTSIIGTTHTDYFDKNSKITAPSVEKKEVGKNWNLLCWSKDPDAESPVQFNCDAGSDVSVVIKAVWTEAYIVSFDLNGGSGDAPENQAVRNNEYAVNPTLIPLRDGYKFNFWSLDGIKEFNFGETPITENIILKAVWKPVFTVTFDKDGGSGVIANQNVAEGELASAPAATPTLSRHHFKGWYIEGSSGLYDFNTPVVSDLTLKAKWIAEIYRLKSVENGQIIINTWSYSPRIAEGDITATYKVDSGAPVDLPIKFVSLSSSLAEYSFDAFTPESATEYTITVTNGYEAKSESFTVGAFAAVTDLTADPDDSKVTLKWTKISGYDNYRVICSNGEEQSVSTTSAVFKGLTNGTEYSFSVYTKSSSSAEAEESSAATVTATPKVTKKTTDWLMLMYMDGDNNLNDPMFLDLNEVEYGLYLIKDSSGSALNGYGSVNVVALWDGWKGNATDSPQIGKPGSYLLEIGCDSSKDITYTNSEGCVLSSDTKDLSYTASWLSAGEVDMSDKDTFVNFLNWAKERYDADNVILQISNHGGGPRSAAKYVTLEDGRKLVITGTDGRRAMCWDDESGGETFLKTADVSSALAEVGYGTENKLGMIILDVCLGASIEEAYEYRNYAEYMIASPNNMPGMGLNYTYLMYSFEDSATLESVGKKAVSYFKSDYKMSSAKWATLVETYTGNGILESNVPIYATEAATLTFVDLSKMNNVKTAFDSIAEVLTSAEAQSKVYDGFYYDSNGYFTETETENPVLYRDFIKERFIRPVSPMNYMGTFTWLFDAGWIINRMLYLSSGSASTSANEWSELYNASVEAYEALSSAIVDSWRDGNNSHNNLYYKSIYPWGILQDQIYGLTVSGGTVEIMTSGDKKTLMPEKNPSWYKTDLEFGKNSKWGDLLSVWFTE